MVFRNCVNVLNNYSKLNRFNYVKCNLQQLRNIRGRNTRNVEPTQTPNDKPNDDYFGIESKDEIVNKKSQISIDKYKTYLNPEKIKEKVHIKSFGKVRYDNENVTLFHGYLDEENNETTNNESPDFIEPSLNDLNKKPLFEEFDTTNGKEVHNNHHLLPNQKFEINQFEDNIFDEKDRTSIVEDINHFSNFKEEANDKKSHNLKKGLINDKHAISKLSNESDLHEFEHSNMFSTNDLSSIETKEKTHIIQQETNSDSNIFKKRESLLKDSIIYEAQESHNKYDQTNEMLLKEFKHYENPKVSAKTLSKEFEHYEIDQHESSKVSASSPLVEKRSKLFNDEDNIADFPKFQASETLSSNSFLQKNDRYKTIITSEAYDFSDDAESSNQKEKPKTAHDYIKQQRGETSDAPTTDSKGYFTYKYLVPNLAKMSEEDLLQLLKENVVYNENDIVAINKPYGLVCQGGETNEYLPDIYGISRKLAIYLFPRDKEPNLFPVHRLDKSTTGVLIFARTKNMLSKLTELYREKKIIKYYWAVTRGVPLEKEGTIDLPIMESSCQTKKRMTCVSADKEFQEYIKKGKGLRALTRFDVINDDSQMALIECATNSGIKHQIRSHLGMGLHCPVLGDHKYSHKDSMAPQKLSLKALLKLGVRQQRVRDIPIHLHAKKVIIPQILPHGQNVMVTAPLPYYFTTTLKKLKIGPGNS